MTSGNHGNHAASRLFDSFNKLLFADPPCAVDVERKEMFPQELAAAGPREAATERFHGSSQLLADVPLKIEYLGGQ